MITIKDNDLAPENTEGASDSLWIHWPSDRKQACHVRNQGSQRSGDSAKGSVSKL